MSKDLFDLVQCLVRQTVGEDAATIYKILMSKQLSKTGLTLRYLRSVAGLTLLQTQEALLRLIVRSAVYIEAQDLPAPSSSSSGAPAAKRYLYFANPTAVLYWLRYPKFISLASTTIGPEAEAMMIELCAAGSLSRAELVARTQVRPLSADYSITALSSNREFAGLTDRQNRLSAVLEHLIVKGYVTPLPVYGGGMTAGAAAQKQELENLALERAAAGAKRRRVSTRASASSIEPRIIQTLALEDSPAHQDSETPVRAVDADDLADSVLWTINPERFMLLLRQEQIVALSARKYTEKAGKIMGILFELGTASGMWMNSPESRTIRLSEIQKVWTASNPGSAAELTEFLSVIVKDPAKLIRPAPSDDEPGYIIRYEAIFDLVQRTEIEGTISQTYDPLALRVFRFIHLHKYAEETQIADECVAPPSEVKRLLMTMYADGLLKIVTVPKTVDRHPLRCIFLFQVDYDHAARFFIARVVRTIKNLVIRSRFLDTSNATLLARLEELANDEYADKPASLSPADTERLTQYRSMSTQLRSTICHLDTALMLFSRFEAVWPFCHPNQAKTSRS